MKQEERGILRVYTVFESDTDFSAATPCPSIQLNLCTYLISGVAGWIRFIFWEVKIGTGRFVIKYKTHPSVAN